MPLRALFVGAVGPRKGIPYLLEAAAPLVRQGKMTLDLIGPIDCPPDALSPWRDIFELRSGLAPNEMPDAYHRADVLVLPSLHEGQAMVCNEALACGLPVICTPNAGSTITDGREGFVVPIRDSAAINAALQAMIDDRGLRERMGIAARQHAERHDVPLFIAELRAILAN